MGAKALLFGLDGLDPAALDAMIDAGAMPGLAALRKTAACHPVENYEGLGAGAFWPSVATGATPGEHGRCFRVEFDRHTYSVGFRDEAKSFHLDSFWQELDREGREIAIIDWPHGPFRPLRNGIILNNWLAHDPSTEFKSLPPAIAGDVVQRYGGDPWAGGAFRYKPETAEAWRGFVAAAVRRIEAKARYCIDRLSEKNWDLFAPTFGEAHDIGHYGQHLIDPLHYAHDAAMTAAVGNPLRPVLEATDRAIASIVAASGPDVAVMLVGGPGMMPLVSGNPMLDLIARRLDSGGGKAAQAEEQAQIAYRSRVPLGVRKLLSPLVRTIRGRPVNRPELASRRFFAVPHTHNSGSIRVNLKGRETYGIVEPARYDALLDEISDGLAEIRNAETGAPIVDKVMRTQEALSGPRVVDLPDLFVLWRREQPFSRVTSPKIGIVDNPPLERTGDHNPHGFLWTARAGRGAAIRPHEATALIVATVKAANRATAPRAPVSLK